jgi:hypothetical protein
MSIQFTATFVKKHYEHITMMVGRQNTGIADQLPHTGKQLGMVKAAFQILL